MKKLFNVFLVLSLIVIGSAGIASARFEREETNVGWVEAKSTQNDEALLTKPVYIFAVTVLADNAANAFVEIYDASASPANGNEPKIEIGEATQYDSKRVVFNPPLKMSTGVYVDVSNTAAVVIEYR